MQTSQYHSIKIKDNLSNKITDHLVVEAPLQININQQSYTVVMRTPGEDIELIRGLLYAEDIYKAKTNFDFKIIDKKEDFSTIIEITIPKEQLGKGYLNKRTLLSVSSCGICGKKEIDDIRVTGKHLTNSHKINTLQIQQMFKKLRDNQETFHVTGGSHAAAVFNTKQELITVKEDIGRHNAVDKCVGHLLQTQQLKQANILLVSGRVSYEIVSKAFFAKIPIIVAVSACSTLAVDFAKEFGICLIGFSRENKMTLYANPQYIDYE